MHKAVQKRFFELITSEVPLYASQANPIQTYKELIVYRFKEVIISAFPRFCEILDETQLDKLIIQFIQSKPETPFIWQMPNEFRHFLSKQSALKTYPFMDDMLWFEWIEIELFMKNYTHKKKINFDWGQSYTLAPSALIKELNFPVYLDEGYDVGGIHPLLMFYNFADHEVHFQELTPFLEQFIALLPHFSALDALQKLCQNYDINPQEVKEILQEHLESFAQNGIFITKDLLC
jgi:hypothetical protein